MLLTRCGSPLRDAEPNFGGRTFGGETGYQETYQEVAGSLVKIKVTAKIFVAGDFGRCPIELITIPFETWTKGRGVLLVCRASTRCPREFPTALVATRATPRIRVRCISWSAVVDNADANAGAAVDKCGVWEPRLENCLAHGEIKNASIESGLSCSI